MENFELLNQGLLDGDKVNESDFLLGTENPLEIPENKNKNNYFYNQGKLKRTRNACVLYANCASLGYLMDYEFSEKELLEVIDLAEEKYGRHEDRGMFISKGVDCVRNYWNTKYPDRKVKTFRMTVGDEDFALALKNNHRVVCGYRTCSEYYKDAQTDGIVQGEKFGPFRGGHCVSSMFGVVEMIQSKKGILIADNYSGSKPYNIYYNNKIAKLRASGTFFPSAFIYLKEETMEDKIRDNIDLIGAQEMFDKGYWNGLSPRKAMSRQEVMTVLNKILKEDIYIQR